MPIFVNRLYRYRETLQKKENPNFESLQDTWLDLAGYAILGLVILSYCQEELN